MLQPPPVVCPDVPTTPLVTVDKPSDAPHLRVVEPIIAVAPNIAFIAPIVILIAIGSKMNIAASGIARSNFIVKGKSFPCVHLLQRDLVIPTSVNFRHDAFNAMAEVRNQRHQAHANPSLHASIVGMSHRRKRTHQP
jgi:hypothetical protein